MRQRFRLCELRAEDYAFSLLSRLLNQLESQVRLSVSLNPSFSLVSKSFAHYTNFKL